MIGMYTSLTDEDGAFLLKRAKDCARYWWVRLGRYGNRTDFEDSAVRGVVEAMEKLHSGYPFENAAHFRAYATMNIKREAARTMQHYDTWLHVRCRGVHMQHREEKAVERLCPLGFRRPIQPGSMEFLDRCGLTPAID